MSKIIAKKNSTGGEVMKEVEQLWLMINGSEL